MDACRYPLYDLVRRKGTTEYYVILERQGGIAEHRVLDVLPTKKLAEGRRKEWEKTTGLTHRVLKIRWL
jgi:hypothetical protein